MTVNPTNYARSLPRFIACNSIVHASFMCVSFIREREVSDPCDRPHSGLARPAARPLHCHISLRSLLINGKERKKEGVPHRLYRAMPSFPTSSPIQSTFMARCHLSISTWLVNGKPFWVNWQNRQKKTTRLENKIPPAPGASVIECKGPFPIFSA